LRGGESHLLPRVVVEAKGRKTAGKKVLLRLVPGESRGKKVETVSIFGEKKWAPLMLEGGGGRGKRVDLTIPMNTA